MASGYVTSDGKDLDSRYLGITAKAASAETADSVSGSSVSKVAGIAEANSVSINVSNKNAGGTTSTATYTVPKRGLVQITCSGASGGSAGTVSGKVYRNNSALFTFSNSSLSYKVNRIDAANTVYKVQFSNNSWNNNTAKISGALVPLSLTAI